jgi:hypothetical protein
MYTLRYDSVRAGQILVGVLAPVEQGHVVHIGRYTVGDIPVYGHYHHCLYLLSFDACSGWCSVEGWKVVVFLSGTFYNLVWFKCISSTFLPASFFFLYVRKTTQVAHSVRPEKNQFNFWHHRFVSCKHH